MYPHRIRLRGPWDYEVLPGAQVLPTAVMRGRVTMPCSIGEAGLAGFSGSVRFSRRFGMPRGHDPEEHHWLVFDAKADSIQVVLNERALGDFAGPGTFAVECTGFLLERNLLEVTLHATNDREGLIGETALEIRRAAYLQNAKVERQADGRLQATVEIAGDPPEAIELYLLAERRTVAYARVVAAGSQLVHMVSEEPVGVEVTEARLELIQGGVVWFQVECGIN